MTKSLGDPFTDFFDPNEAKLFQDQLKELRDSVNNDTYDNVAVEIASTIMNHIYDEYDKKLNSKISKYNNSVNRAIANNRIKGILLRIIQKLLQLVIVAGLQLYLSF